jgi:hypothetical protein
MQNHATALDFYTTNQPRWFGKKTVDELQSLASAAATRQTGAIANLVSGGMNTPDAMGQAKAAMTAASAFMNEFNGDFEKASEAVRNTNRDSSGKPISPEFHEAVIEQMRIMSSGSTSSSGGGESDLTMPTGGEPDNSVQGLKDRYKGWDIRLGPGDTIWGTSPDGQSQRISLKHTKFYQGSTGGMKDPNFETYQNMLKAFGLK